MPSEIERKFLVTSDAWRAFAREATRYRQGYLAYGEACVVRVRVAGAQAFLTIKGRLEGLTRAEFEYPIPQDDAEALLASLAAGAVIEKTRYLVPHAGHTWEVDVFAGENEGLVVAELELAREDEPFTRPPWLGREVSRDPRYQNANLARNPYRRWPSAAR